MNNTVYKSHTLYLYKDDLLGCNVLRHKYAPGEYIVLNVRDFGDDKIDITENNMEFLIHPSDQKRASALLIKS